MAMTIPAVALSLPDSPLFPRPHICPLCIHWPQHASDIPPLTPLQEPFLCLPVLKGPGCSRGPSWEGSGRELVSISELLLPLLPPQLSPYPVILSLENHCGLQQQAVMAHHLRTILGDMLVTQALDSQNPEELPSPEVMLADPQPGWGRVCLQSTIHPCSCHFLVQDPSPLSALTFPCSSFHLTSVTP